MDINFNKIAVFVSAVLAGIALSACSSATEDAGKKYVSREVDNGAIKYKTYGSDIPWKAEVDMRYAEFLPQYDAKEHMCTVDVKKWNYHTDKIGVTYHHISKTLRFVALMLETGDDSLLPEVEASLNEVLSLQQNDKTKDYYGIWPYYKEEPVLTKKSPVDWNMANFPAIALLDIYMRHGERLGAQMCEKMRTAILAATDSILRRNLSIAYTNVAIIDIYVLYMSANLFDDAKLKAVAQERINDYYDYVKSVGGFNEFNSPTYTIAAVRDLCKLRQHLTDKNIQKKIDELLDIEWSMIARHYHAPTKQWGGPHSRAYYTLAETKEGSKTPVPTSYYIIQHACAGTVDFGIKVPWDIRKIEMKMPEYLKEYFIAPKLPRVERERFTNNCGVVGTNYMTAQYSLATANNSTMWNQARPLLMHFRNADGAAASLQPRFLHDGFDFSSVFFTSEQDGDKILCAFSYLTDGGDKHIYIDKTNGKFSAKDLRLSFATFNSDCKITLPKKESGMALMDLKSVKIGIKIESFGDMRGKWEIGKDGKSLDYVIWSGSEKEFDLTKMKEAAIVCAFEINPSVESEISVDKKGADLKASWKNLSVVSKLKPTNTQSHREQFHSEFVDFPEWANPQKIGLKLANKFIASPNSKYGDTSKPTSQITYPDVCTWLGALWFSKTTGDAQLAQKLQARFQPLFGADKRLQPKPNHVDNNVFGALALELFMQTGRKDYKDLGLMYADTQWTLPRNAKPSEVEWAKQGYSWQTRLWLDDMFMINAVQSQAYRVTGDRKYIDRAAREMVLYLEKIQCPNGLFYHSPETPFHWGRGNGWLAVGMAEVLRALPKDNPHRAEIMRRYKMMMKTLLKYQSEDGMWRQLVDDKESWKETSSTAMFAYAMIVGVKNGWLDDPSYGWLGASSEYAKAARKAWLSMVKYIDKNDNVREVCMGTNIKNSREHYMTRPRIVGDLHGQAPYIWCANALLE